jgi:triacylglycerol lipase
VIRSSRTPRVLGSLALLGATVAGSVALSTGPASAAKKVDPVLLVHGFTRTSADFGSMIAELKANDYPDDRIFTIDYNSFAPNAYTATLVAAKVQSILAQTGADKVDLITHSMGAYSTRYFIKNMGGDKVVGDFVSIAGPNHGTTAGTDSPQCGALPSCVEMRPGSAFLTQLNTGDETPGDVRYLTFWSSCDDLVVPAAQSTPLEGAKNRETKECMGHMTLAVDEDVIKRTVNFVHS